jgi:O-antigen/teichoic acid export membrane protein
MHPAPPPAPSPAPSPSPLPPAAVARLGRGASLHVAARVLSLALGLALLLWVARLGPAVQGALALVMALDALLVAAGSGLGLWLARAAASQHGAALQRLVGRTLGLAVAAGTGAALGLSAAAAATQAAPWAPLGALALAVPVLLCVPTATGLWLGQGRLLAHNLPAVATPALVLVLLAALPATRAALAGGAGSPAAGSIEAIAAVLLCWALARAAVGLGCAAWALARPGGGVHAPAAPTPPASPATAPMPWREIGRFTLTVGAANALSLLNLRATLFLLERWHGLETAGVYAVAVQVAELLWVLSAAVSVATYHRLAGDPAVAARLALHALRLGVALAGAAALPLALAAGAVLPALLGPDYAASVLPLLLLLPGVVMYAGASALSAFHTHALGRPQWAARVAALSLVLTVTIGVFTVPRWGAAGAAVATTLAFSAAMGLALHGFLTGPHGPGWRALWRGAGPTMHRDAP